MEAPRNHPFFDDLVVKAMVTLGSGIHKELADAGCIRPPQVGSPSCLLDAAAFYDFSSCRSLSSP